MKKYADMTNAREKITALLDQIKCEVGKFPIVGDYAKYYLLFNLKLKQLKSLITGHQVPQPVLFQKAYRM